EVLLGDLSRRPAVGAVVRADLVEGVEDLVHAPEGEQPAAGRQYLAEARVLGDYRTARGQVARAAVAEPAAARTNVLVLGHRELAGRSNDVLAVRFHPPREGGTVHHAPAVAAEAPDRAGVGAAERELERMRSAVR